MRVGVYIAGRSPEVGGGYTFENDVFRGLLELHRKSRHAFTILCPTGAYNGLRREAESSGIVVSPVPEDSKLSRWGEALRRELAFVRAHWRRPTPLDRAAAAAEVDFLWFVSAGIHCTDLPFLTVVWDLQHRLTPWFPEMSACGLWDRRELSHRWFLPRAAGVVTGTRIGQFELERFYQVPSERVLILPHPTPAFALAAAGQAADPDTPARLGVEGPFILYPAQFWPHKNHVNLVLALQLLRQRYGLPLSLVLVGSDKGNRAQVEQMAARCGVAEAVRFLGFVSREDLVALYCKAVALTYMSWCGPENLPPLEAFALGCPVVATDIPGASEQLGEAAMLVLPGSPESIATGIKQVWEDAELRERLVLAGHVRARKWTARDYVHGVFEFLDRFEPIIRCWRVST